MRFVSYYPRAVSDRSGVTAALWGWAAALVDAGHDVRVLHAGGNRRSPEPGDMRPNLADEAIPHRGRGRTTHRPIGLERWLAPDDVLILHEGWVMSNVIAARAARRAGIPYVVVPHGVYEPGIRAMLKPPRRLRERVERRVLEKAAGVHVFFSSEEPLVRSIAPRAPDMIVAPNGFAPGAERWTGGGGYLAWIGRYDPPHKGLDLLVNAVASLDPAERPTIELRGPDYNGGYDRIRSQIDRLGVAEWVHAEGPVYAADKLDLLRRSDGYVMPSRWDACPIALIENLGMGAPCLVSDSIQMAGPLAAAAAAVPASATADGLADGLRRFGAMSAADREAIGSRGRAWVAGTLAWPDVVTAFVDGVAAATQRGSARKLAAG
jgi:glycosyltransferase involved in cell wall biosynthesis